MNIKLAIGDKDPAYRKLVFKMITRQNLFHQVSSFSSIQSMLNFFHCFNRNSSMLPDILLIDSRIQDADVWQVMEKLDPMIPHLIKKPKIYICTGVVDNEMKEKARKFSFVEGFLLKPFLGDQLKKVTGVAA